MARPLARGRTGISPAPFGTDALDAANAAAERALPDVCTITRPDGEPVFDEDTGTYVQQMTVVYTGPCLFGHEQENARVQAQGEEAVPLRRYDFHLPLRASDVAEQDTVVINQCHDPYPAGRTFTVFGTSGDSTEPLRHITIQEQL